VSISAPSKPSSVDSTDIGGPAAHTPEPAQQFAAPEAGTATAPCWQKQLANMITDERELLEFVGLKSARKAGNKPARSALKPSFPLRVTHAFASRIGKGNPRDPLLLQVLPQPAESTETSQYLPQPLLEESFQRSPGVLQKYQGRALIIVNGTCAIHCRYCFRQNFPYQSMRQSRQLWQQTLSTIRSDHTLEEIIFSGGDPLLLSDKHLTGLIGDLEHIPHVNTLRIHSRIPIVLPARITDSLTAILAGSRLRIVNVIHCNHGNEIDQQVGDALTKLKSVSSALLNQTVLLRGINDNSDSLACLSRKLFDHDVLPYYLHMLDKVSGTAHFKADREALQKIMPELRSQLPGYLVPKAVQEIPGEPSKSPILV